MISKHSSPSLYITTYLTLKDSLFSNDRTSFKNQFHRLKLYLGKGKKKEEKDKKHVGSEGLLIRQISPCQQELRLKKP